MESDPQRAEETAGADGPRRGWWGRNWRWFVPTFALVLLALLGVCAVIVWCIVFGTLKSSEPYKMALERVKQHPLALEQLGEPVEDDDWFPGGEIFSEGGSGEARLFFHVAGPKGRAKVATWGQQRNGNWALVQLALTLEDNERLDLGQVADETLPEAPPWKPPQ